MSAKSLFRRLETRAVLPSADGWLELASIRNTLVHGYRTNVRREFDRVLLAYGIVAPLTDTVETVLAFIDREVLLQPRSVMTSSRSG